MSLENLHEDIITEILLRLRVKSLVRFRCASKGWFSLITDPRFAHRHLKRASENTQSQRVIFPFSTGIRSLGVDELCGDSFPLKQLVLPFKQPICDVSILGTCNGLVCVSRYEVGDFYIWNPSTADCRKLRDPWIEPSWVGNRYLYGFGYDLSSDDYKVLVATSRDGSRPLVTAAQVQVFSLKTNSWKQIQYAALDYPSEPVCWSWESLGTFSNGALHWKIEWRPDVRHGIIAFDLADEKFRNVPTPMDEARIYIHDLSNLGGRLCFTCDRNYHLEVWGMMDYGVQESWARLFKVYHHEHRIGLIPLLTDLLGLNADGEILECSSVFSSPIWCPPWSQPVVFVESLLSPNTLLSG